MPDTKFSLPALREHLRRYFWIYLVGIALCLFGTGLLWTTTAPRLANDEMVTVYLADSYTNPEVLSGIADDMLAETQAFDERLKLVEFNALQYTEDDYNSQILLLTRLAVGEGDAFLASQAAIDALVQSQVLLALDAPVAEGWLAEYGLEPYYETGESETLLAGLRLDTVSALSDMGAFYNEGAYLCVAANGGNVETTMKALEVMMRDLTEGKYASTDDTEPAA